MSVLFFSSHNQIVYLNYQLSYHKPIAYQMVEGVTNAFNVIQVASLCHIFNYFYHLFIFFVNIAHTLLEMSVTRSVRADI